MTGELAMKSLAYAILMLVVMSCASQQTKVTRVDKGMSKNQVIDVLGSPNDRTFQGTTERWIYPALTPGTKKVVVFENGQVVEFLNAKATDTVLHEAQGDKLGHKHCDGKNRWGQFSKGGGCNMYGCWPAGGYCNGFGCSSSGRCTNNGCPNKIDSYICAD